MSTNILTFWPKCIKQEFSSRKPKIDTIRCPSNYRISLLKNNPSAMTLEAPSRSSKEKLPKKRPTADLSNLSSKIKLKSGKTEKVGSPKSFRTFVSRF
jgi:hypothetical protein